MLFVVMMVVVALASIEDVHDKTVPRPRNKSCFSAHFFSKFGQSPGFFFLFFRIYFLIFQIFRVFLSFHPKANKNFDMQGLLMR